MFDFGPYLVDGGVASMGGVHLNQRSSCSRNHWSSNTTSHLFQRQGSNDYTNLSLTRADHTIAVVDMR